MSVRTTKSRNNLLDNIKGLLIFLVVLGHSLELYRTQHFIFEAFFNFIQFFHMPAFVFISGYLSKDVDKCRKTAFTSFFIPFVFFNTLWNLLAFVFLSVPFSFITPGWALWYLLSMFIWRLFLKDLVRIKGIVPLSLAIGLCAGIFKEFDALLSLSRTLVFLPFFLMGYFLSEEHLFSFKRPSRLFSIVIFGVIMGFAFLLARTNIVPVEFLYGSSSFSDFTLPLWIGLSARAFLYLIGIYFIFVLVNVMPSRPTFFSKIGQNTFPVYILHTYLLVLVFWVNHLFDALWLQIILCIISSVCITYFLSRNCVNRIFNKVLQFLIGCIQR